MARKTKAVEIDGDRAGRDHGKVFLITEMPATQAERWAFRAFLALARSGIELPDNVEGAGMAGIAALGLKALAGVDANEAISLMDELMTCVAAIPNRARPDIMRSLVDSDTEEVATRLRLRMEVFELHTGFSVAAALLPSKSAIKSAA